MSPQTASILGLVAMFVIATALPINMGALALAMAFLIGTLSVGMSSERDHRRLPRRPLRHAGRHHLPVRHRAEERHDRLAGAPGGAGGGRADRGDPLDHVRGGRGVDRGRRGLARGLRHPGPGRAAIRPGLRHQPADDGAAGDPWRPGRRLLPHQHLWRHHQPGRRRGPACRSARPRSSSPASASTCSARSASSSSSAAPRCWDGGRSRRRRRAAAAPVDRHIGIEGHGRAPMPASPPAGAVPPPARLDLQQMATLVGLGGAGGRRAGFGLNVGLVAVTVAVALTLLAPNEQKGAVDKIGWSTILLVGGVITYVGVLQKSGAIDSVGAGRLRHGRAAAGGAAALLHRRRGLGLRVVGRACWAPSSRWRCPSCSRARSARRG